SKEKRKLIFVWLRSSMLVVANRSPIPRKRAKSNPSSSLAFGLRSAVFRIGGTDHEKEIAGCDTTHGSFAIRRDSRLRWHWNRYWRLRKWVLRRAASSSSRVRASVPWPRLLVGRRLLVWRWSASLVACRLLGSARA